MDRNQMDMRYQDGRNPYGSEGGYVVSSRGRSRGRGRGRGRDRGMYPMEHHMPMGDMRGQDYDMARGGQGGRGRDRGMNDYGDYRAYDMRGGQDGHHMAQGQGGATYYPIQAMGTFEGYYGMPEQDYARGGRRDYGYSMGGGYDRQGADYGYGRRDYGYDYGYDYGQDERLSEEELEHWCKKLKKQLDEREKQMFSKEMISQKAKQMGKEMKGFSEKELEVLCLALYDDYKKTIGQNPDLIIKLAFDWMNDQDSEVKGSEKLALYHDLVMGEL